MLEGIKVFCHSSIAIRKEKTIYIDPFKINENYNDADIIMITHDHFDHYSEQDIEKVRKSDSIIVIPESLYTKVLKIGFMEENIITVEPNKKYIAKNVKFTTIPAYNVDKQFHPKENGWVGYLIKLDGNIYYIAGDTDITTENRDVECDVAFLPIGGTYTMNYEEAAMLANIIKPNIVVPIHYGEIVGKKEDAEKFKSLINPEIQCEILIK